MIFPELKRNEVNSMKASEAFFKGLIRRLFRERHEKVFIIGFHKTGTSSMGKALQILGYKVCGSIKEGKDYNNQVNNKEYILKSAIPLLNNYDAFQDTPWFIFYRELYEMYPTAFFILTTRDDSKWIKSVQKHFGDKKYKYHDMIYGTFDSLKYPDKYLSVYKQHNKECITFFKDKPNFLALDLDEFDWAKLTSFLNLKAPSTRFPVANKSSDKRKLSWKLKKKIKKFLYN